MNKTIIKLGAFAVAICFAISSASAVPSIIIKGEADIVRAGHPNVHVDWIVANDDLATTFGASDFVFINLPNYDGKGNKAAYDASTWYYYYQIENTTDVSLSSLTLQFLDPDIITSMGYIEDANIDTDLDNGGHTGVIGDDETTAGGTLRNPIGHKFDPNILDPNATWTYPGINELPIGDFSTVLFLTSNTPPINDTVTILNGAAYTGILPIPDTTVPEPFSIILLGGSIVGMVLKRRK